MNFFRLSAFIVVCALSAPSADFATYIGNSYAYTVTAIAADSMGNTYATGYRTVIVFAAGNTASDVFVTKIDASGNVTLLATLSGKGSDQGNGIAIDPTGNIYIAGSTTSPDFPLLNPLQSVIGLSPGYGSGFLTKLAADGSIIYSTYLGGSQGSSVMNAVVVDALGNAYVTGSTFASDYPHTAGLPNDDAFSTVGGASVAFFAKVSSAGNKILYAGGIAGGGHACGAGSSCFTSTISSSGAAIALDSVGDAYIAGNTYGLGLPTTSGALNATGIGALVFEVNAAGTAIGYATLLASANYAPPPVSSDSAPGTIVNAIAVDASGDAYITGWTADPKFPATMGAFQSQPNFTAPANNPFAMPPRDAFVAKLNASGTAMVWASFLGGTGTDVGTRITLDAADNVWVAGTTQSADFPATSGFPGGGEFVVEFNPAGSALAYAARFPAGTSQAGLAIDANGALHLAGATGLVSTLTPGSSNARLFGISNAAAGAMAGRVAPAEVISIYGLHLGVSTPVSATFNGAGLMPETLGGVRVMIGGFAAPLLYVSDTQINAVVPVELAAGSVATLQVSNGAASLPAFRMAVDEVIPGVFLEPNGTAAVINQDGTLNSASNAAPSGSIVSMWATGVSYAPGSDGQMATVAQQTCSCVIYDDLHGTNFSPSYAGAAPGMVNGVTQINFTVSAGAAPVVAYQLYADGNNSNIFSVYVKP